MCLAELVESFHYVAWSFVPDGGDLRSPRFFRHRTSARGHGRQTKPLHAVPTFRAGLFAVALSVQAQAEVAHARSAILVDGAFGRRAVSAEAETARSAIGIPIALFFALPGTAISVAWTRDRKANAANAAAIVSGTGGVVLPETGEVGSAFARGA